MNRLAVQTTALGAASSAGALLVGSGRGSGATKLVEPRTAVELNNALEKASAELDAAATAVRRTLSLAAAGLLTDLEIQLDIVATLDSIALRARHAAAVNAAEPTLRGPGEGATVQALRHPLLIERIEGPFWEPSYKKASARLAPLLLSTHTRE
jgi:dsDNA-specific endonuclease/ATPase MutS2